MIYLASPYSNPNPEIVASRFSAVELAAATLMKKGQFVWSPIVHCHALAIAHNLPTDAEFWKSYNFDFMRRADAMYLLQLDGWEESKGLKMEIEFCEYTGLPLYYIHPDAEYRLSPRPYAGDPRMALTLGDMKLKAGVVDSNFAGNL